MSNQAKSTKELVRKLHSLREVPPRSPKHSAMGKKRFLSQAESLQLHPVQGIADLSQEPSRAARFFNWNWARAGAISLIFLFVMGVNISFAAQSALPSETLFPVKVAMEELQLALEADAAQDARLLLRFSQRRVSEIKELVRTGRNEGLSIPVDLYRENISQLTSIIQFLREEGNAEIQELLDQIVLDLTAHENDIATLIAADSTLANSELDSIVAIAKSIQSAENEADSGQVTAALTAVSPNKGQAGRTMSLYIRGQDTNFNEDSQVHFNIQRGIRILGLTVLGPNELIVQIQILDDAEVGQIQIAVVSGEEKAQGLSFDVYANEDASDDAGQANEDDPEIGGPNDGEDEEDNSGSGSSDEHGEDNSGSGSSDDDKDNSGSGSSDEHGEDNSGSCSSNDDKEDNSGSGSSDEHSEDNSGSCSSNDDEEDNSGSGSSDHDEEEDEEDD